LLDGNGVAVLSRANLNADTYPITAVYLGDTVNQGSTSAVLKQVVKQATSAAQISSSLNPSVHGQSVTFMATITSPTVKPTGQVAFTVGSTALGTAQLSGGKAALSTSALAIGLRKITVTYDGNANITKGSASLTQKIE